MLLFRFKCWCFIRNVIGEFSFTLKLSVAVYDCTCYGCLWIYSPTQSAWPEPWEVFQITPTCSVFKMSVLIKVTGSLTLLNSGNRFLILIFLDWQLRWQRWAFPLPWNTTFFTWLPVLLGFLQVPRLFLNLLWLFCSLFLVSNCCIPLVLSAWTFFLTTWSLLVVSSRPMVLNTTDMPTTTKRVSRSQISHLNCRPLVSRRPLLISICFST